MGVPVLRQGCATAQHTPQQGHSCSAMVQKSVVRQGSHAGTGPCLRKWGGGFRNRIMGRISVFPGGNILWDGFPGRKGCLVVLEVQIRRGITLACLQGRVSRSEKTYKYHEQGCP